MARTDDIAHFRIRLAENNQPLGTELLENETTLFDTAQKHSPRTTMIENDEGGSSCAGKQGSPEPSFFGFSPAAVPVGTPRVLSISIAGRLSPMIASVLLE